MDPKCSLPQIFGFHLAGWLNIVSIYKNMCYLLLWSMPISNVKSNSKFGYYANDTLFILQIVLLDVFSVQT